MFSDRAPRISRTLRRKLFVNGVFTTQQTALAIIVRNILVRAGFSETTEEEFFEGEGMGFSLWVDSERNGIGSISVNHSQHLTQKEAQRYVRAIIGAFQAHIGVEQAKRLVKVTPRRLDFRGGGLTDGRGKPVDYVDYLDVTVAVPDAPTLRALYRVLGRH